MMFKTFAWILISLSLVACSRNEGTVRDPGAAGKKTIEGIDRDKDGVRDDLQVWIDEAFSNEERVRDAVREMAKTHPASCEFKHKVQCLETIVGFERSFEIEVELMERYLNTPDRQKDFEQKLEPCPLFEDMAAVKCNYEID
jgi:hypothetical protein